MGKNTDIKKQCMTRTQNVIYFASDYLYFSPENI